MMLYYVILCYVIMPSRELGETREHLYEEFARLAETRLVEITQITLT